MEKKIKRSRGEFSFYSSEQIHFYSLRLNQESVTIILAENNPGNFIWWLSTFESEDRHHSNINLARRGRKIRKLGEEDGNMQLFFFACLFSLGFKSVSLMLNDGDDWANDTKFWHYNDYCSHLFTTLGLQVSSSVCLDKSSQTDSRTGRKSARRESSQLKFYLSFPPFWLLLSQFQLVGFVSLQFYEKSTWKEGSRERNEGRQI